MIPADEALRRLKEGNARYASDLRSLTSLLSHIRRPELVEGQKPFAVILGCSDSRVPAELVFDQGLGDLFVIRIAGNIVAPSQIGSVEFAAGTIGARLVVVLGHTHCGAINATFEQKNQSGDSPSSHVLSIVDRIRPIVTSVQEAYPDLDRNAQQEKAVRANVQASVRTLCADSRVISRLIEEDGLRVVGAEYSLETGIVDFF